MHVNGSHCGDLVEKTAAALNDDAVMLMLLAVQRNNVELSVKYAWKHVHGLAIIKVENVIEECLFAFPYIWLNGKMNWICLLMNLFLKNLKNILN